MARTPLFQALSRTIASEAQGAGIDMPSQSALSRRQVLTLSAASAVFALTAGYSGDATALQKPPGKHASSIAIVGGGAAGLTAAYRLVGAGLVPTVFEASNRLGGRMFTVRDFYQGLFGELGGEFVDTKHDDIRGLVSELGLQLERLQATDDKSEDLYYVSGAFRRTTDMLDPATGRGAFVPIAKRIAADNAKLLDASRDWTPHARRLDQMSLEAYLAGFKGLAETWVLDLLRVAYVSEFGLPLAEQSALNLIDMIGTDPAKKLQIFGDSDEAFRIKGGSSAFIDTLAGRLDGKCETKLGFQLTRIERNRDANFKLTFDAPGGTVASQTFDAVVLALPFTQLRTVLGIEKLGLSKPKLEAIRTLGYGNNAKLLCGTKTRPWRTGEASLPAPSTGNFLSDLPFQSVWDSSRVQRGEAGLLSNFLAGAAALASETETYDALAKGLRTLSPKIADSLDPDAVTLFQWARHPFSLGSYASARPGQYTRLLEICGQPELQGRLQFAGEHTSRAFLGYMNGAVQSGNKAAHALVRTFMHQDTK